ncbi:MAG: ACT domain-containing protein [Roseiflexaceae bacterium]
MAGEQNLAVLLNTMQPALHPTPYIICSVAPDRWQALAPLARGTFHEAEGLTLMLEAIGFMATIAGRLAAHAISVNAVAGYYHDHLFVQWERRLDAMHALQQGTHGEHA